MSERYPTIRVHADDGELVVRDGIILCFFIRRSHREVAQALWNALQVYRRAILPGTLNWYGAPDGDTLPLDDKGWEHIRERILEQPEAIGCHVELDELTGGTGGYNFEYHGVQLDDPFFAGNEGATCSAAFSFPTEYLLAHGPAHLRDLALELARELPFSFGYASFALVCPGSWFRVRRQLLPLLERYLGLDIYSIINTSMVIGTRARGAYWLTFLGQPLLGELGGIEALRQKLAFPAVTVEPLKGERVLLTLGEWPDAIDTTQEPLVPHLRTLARLLEPFLCVDKIALTSLLDKQSIQRWLRRLCR
jgi:hypothetical protein